MMHRRRGRWAGRDGRRRLAPASAGIAVIELYRQLISPLRPPSCRFVPSCSQYAVEALREYGLIRGSGLAGVRLAKCGPWHRGGWDPVPERGIETVCGGHRGTVAKLEENERCV